MNHSRKPSDREGKKRNVREVRGKDRPLGGKFERKRKEEGYENPPRERGKLPGGKEADRWPRS